MAEVNLPGAFGYKWAENGTVDPMDDSQYKLGWAFIGATPPSVEQFNKVLQILDEKANYLNSKRIGSLRSAVTVAAPATLNAGHVGQLVIVSGVAGNSVTLPNATTLGLESGARIQIAAGSLVNIVSVNGNILGSNSPSGGGGAGFIRLNPGTNSEFIWTGSYWITVNGAALGNLAQNGYQFWANGLLYQWGQVDSPSTAATLPLSFNQAFPNACFCVLLTGWSSAYGYAHVGRNSAGCTLVRNTAPNYQVDWLAIGY